MPRKRIAAQAGIGGLAPETVDVLLDGWGASHHDYSDNPASDWVDAFARDLGETWRANRAALFAEWTRRGGTGQPVGAQFDVRT
jgi:hypothetical protein